MLKQLTPQLTKEAGIQKTLSLRGNVEELENQLIHDALLKAGGNINKAAKLLEIPRQTLQYKLKKSRK
jgi:arginine utilization regulatory protein